MEPVTNATVYIVDDDADVRERFGVAAAFAPSHSESFASAEAFLRNASTNAPCPATPSACCWMCA